MKKTMVTIIAVIIFSMLASGCAQNVNSPSTEGAENPQTPETAEATEPAEPVDVNKKQRKIGIITGPADQFQEEYLAALNLKEKYGEMVEISLYPDIKEPKANALALNMKSLADGGAEAIVISPGVTGTAEAMQRVRDSYPDMFFVCGASGESRELIASVADIVLNVDDEGAPEAIVRQARKMGAKVFVHYTYARHMGEAALSARRDAFREACNEEGIQFVDATIPDPLDVGGAVAAIGFVQEDVPRMVASYGTDTAFYATEEVVQEALINAVLWEGALFPLQCVPSPFYAYPGAFEFEIPYESKDDVSYVLDEINKSVTAKGGEGRFSTWPVPLNDLFIEAGTEYALSFLKGETLSRNDSAKLKQICEGVAGGYNVAFSNYDSPTGVKLENYYFILPDFINF